MIRKEYKFVLNEYELKEFFFYYSSELKSLYPDRAVTSLYLDTLNFGIFTHNSNNDINKYTYRFRSYNRDMITEEIKFNDKSKSKTVNETLFKNFNEIKYVVYRNRILFPSVFTYYNRSYFQLQNTRVTLDRNIKYYSHSFRSAHKKSFGEKVNILEMKLQDNKKDLNIEKNLFSNPQAFSKFNEATRKLYFNEFN